METITIFCVMIAVTSASDVIIIGAGVAGVGAARKLVNAGGHRVTVREARDRVGGRTWTDLQALPNAVGSEVDKGASWIHGARPGHPVKELADKFNLTTFATDELDPIYYSNGSEAGEKAWFTFSRLVGQIGSEYGEEDISLWDAIVDLEEEDTAKEPAVAFYIAYGIEFNLGAPIQNISTQAKDDLLGSRKKRRRRRKREEETKELLLVNGYIGIINGLTNGVDDETPIPMVDPDDTSDSPRIILKSVVTKVERGGTAQDPWMQITAGSKVYEADFVIVTLPLGVLKENTVKFLPALSKEKTDAIKSVGFGNANKLMMEWNQSFWDSLDELTFLDWRRAIGRIGMLHLYLNAKEIVNRPVLITYMLGNDADESESLSDDQLKDKALANLNQMFDIPSNNEEPTHVTRTAWRTDPFTRGCYSYLKVGAREEDFTELSKPECPLFFAGEHTSEDNYETTHGAYLSGLRAADEVIKAAKEGCPRVSSLTPLLLKGSIFQTTAMSVSVFMIYYQYKLGVPC